MKSSKKEKDNEELLLSTLIKRIVFSVVGIIVGLVLIFSVLYKNPYKYTTLVVQLGKIKTIENNAGLHAKAPFISKTVQIYMGDNMYDIAPSDVITADKKSMIADNFVVWQVTDPVLYYKTLGAIDGRAEERIDAAVYNATKNTISSMTQSEIIAARGKTLTNMITKESNSDISQYGIVIKSAEIKALDLPDDNKNAVFERMISERAKIAASYTAQGEADARLIKNDTDRQVKEITAEANKEATILIAEGEAEYMSILSDAYGSTEKAAFYSYLRGLDSLKSLVNKDNTIILDKNSEYARILYGGY